MNSSKKYKNFVIFMVMMRWFYGSLLMITSIISLSQVHEITIHSSHPAIIAYNISPCCNFFILITLSILQLIIGLCLLVPKTSRYAAYAGACCFAYIVTRLWAQGAPLWPSIVINSALALGLLMLAPLLNLQNIIHSIHK